LQRRGCAVTLLVSPKEIDQQAVKVLERRSPDRRGDNDSKRADLEIGAPIEVATLPSIGLTRGRVLAFARAFVQSYRAAKNLFRSHPPQGVLAMGGFTSAPPVLAAKKLGARTFLHESNTIPGRANRWLSWVVDQAFVGFPQAGARLNTRSVTVTGTPVRPQFQPRDAAACRVALGLDPDRPTLLVMGGSQGASGINDLIIGALEVLARTAPGLQLIHLAGPNDAEKVRAAAAAVGLKAVVHAFFAEMEIALGAATVAVSRAGASSLAELAAMRVPSILIPFPAATDNHQFFNARAFEQTGAAQLLQQKSASVQILAGSIRDLIERTTAREAMRTALAQWHQPQAAEQIAEKILERVATWERRRLAGETPALPGSQRDSRSERSFAQSWSSALRY
jgi:UDP-N-acetylglucosamine--N-acetylmuramyl-(pentapeptide) pyrophosphoryl-undecaprenol N-acetylglucosamine transferase